MGGRQDNDTNRRSKHERRTSEAQAPGAAGLPDSGRYPLSRGYLALIAASLIRVWVDASFVPHQDASFAGVWPIMFTAPASLLFLISGAEGPGSLVLLAVAALVNSAVISLVVRTPRGGRRSRHTSGPASARQGNVPPRPPPAGAHDGTRHR